MIEAMVRLFIRLKLQHALLHSLRHMLETHAPSRFNLNAIGLSLWHNERGTTASSVYNIDGERGAELRRPIVMEWGQDLRRIISA